MRLQRLTHYLLQHRYLTMLFVLLVTFVPLIGVIGILIAALVTLRKGVIEGARLTLAATLPYAISFYFSEKEEGTLVVVWAAVLVAVLSNFSTWIFAVMLRRQANFSTVLQLGALGGVLVISVIHLAYPDVTSWWGNQLQSYYNEAKNAASLLGNQVGNQEGKSQAMQLDAINITRQYATGFMVGGILLNAILQLIAVRWWEAVVFYPRRLHKELQNIRLSQLAGGLFILGILFSYWGNAVVLDIMPVPYLLFCGAGFSLIHYFFKQLDSKTSWSWFWLLVLYIAFFISMPTSIIFIAMIGLFDIWIDMRKRFRKV